MIKDSNNQTLKKKTILNNLFTKRKSLLINKTLVNIDKPVVMGILNITEDSFFDGGSFFEVNKAVDHLGKMLSDGAFIIDIGCQSTRPGAKMLNENIEIERLAPILEKIKTHFPSCIVSIDTFYAKVAEFSIHNGAHIINDISGGLFDQNMLPIISKFKTPYILMHTSDIPEKMQQNTNYMNVTKSVQYFFSQQLDICEKLGITDIILDPGFGFGKTSAQNFELLHNLDSFKLFNRLILVGLSRKSMIWKTLNISSKTALNGTTSLHTIAVLKGADIVRAHDVAEAVEVIKLLEQFDK